MKQAGESQAAEMTKFVSIRQSTMTHSTLSLYSVAPYNIQHPQTPSLVHISRFSYMHILIDPFKDR
jgi:hypothetical protein